MDKFSDQKSIDTCFLNLIFPSNIDDEGVVIKSTRHAGNFGGNFNNVLSPTPSTILVHGLLGEVCIADSDCSIFNSHCEPTYKRCACKPDTVQADQGKICKFASEQRVIPPTVLISKFLFFVALLKTRQSTRAILLCNVPV